MADESDCKSAAASRRRPLYLDFRSSKGFIASTVFAATFTDGFAYGITVPVMPFALVDRSGVAPDQVDFWNSGFLVTFGLAQILASPLIGWWTDRSSSRRAPFLTGLALIFVASFLLCFATRPWVMMVARALAGFSAGVVFCTGLTLVVDSVPRQEIGGWIGFALSGMTWGTMVGPLLGGVIYKRAGYHAVFLTLLGVIALDFALRLIMIETGEAFEWRKAEVMVPNESRDDDPEQSQSNGGMQHQEIWPREHGDQREPKRARLLKTCKSLGRGNKTYSSAKRQADERTSLLESLEPAAPWYQRRFPGLTALLSSKRLIAAVLGTFVYNSLITSFDDILPLFALRTFNWDSEYAGLLYLTIPIPTLSSPFIGKLSDRYGARVVALFGFALTTPCLALLSLVHENTREQIAILVVLLLLFGIGVNFIIGPLASDMSFVVEDLSREQPELFGKAGAYAQAYSFFASAMAGGVMFGPAVAGVLYKNTSWQITMGVLAGLCALGSIPVYQYSGGPASKPPDDDSTGVEA